MFFRNQICFLRAGLAWNFAIHSISCGFAENNNRRIFVVFANESGASLHPHPALLFNLITCPNMSDSDSSSDESNIRKCQQHRRKVIASLLAIDLLYREDERKPERNRSIWCLNRSPHDPDDIIRSSLNDRLFFERVSNEPCILPQTC